MYYIIRHMSRIWAVWYAHICRSFIRIITHLKHFSWRRNVRKATFFGRKQWRHILVSLWLHRGAFADSSSHLMQYVIQYYFCNKSEIYGAHGKNNEKQIRGLQRLLHPAVATCVLPFSMLSHGALRRWSLIINKCIFLTAIVLFMITCTYK